MVSSIFLIIFFNLIYIIRFPTGHLMLQSKIIIQFFGLFFFQPQFLINFNYWFQCSPFLACMRITHKFVIKIMPQTTCRFVPLKIIIVCRTDDSQKDIVTELLTRVRELPVNPLLDGQELLGCLCVKAVFCHYGLDKGLLLTTVLHILCISISRQVVGPSQVRWNFKDPCLCIPARFDLG